MAKKENKTNEVKDTKKAKGAAEATDKKDAADKKAIKKEGVVGWQKHLSPLRRLTESMLSLQEMPTKPAAAVVAALKSEILKTKKDLEAKGVTIPKRLAGRLAKAIG